MENSRIIIGYLIYLPIVITLTIYISKILFKNSKLFMIDIFRGEKNIATSTNNLFQIGFYLINIGFALFIMKIHIYTNNGISYQKLIEILSHKIGGFTIDLGAMLFLNLFLFVRGRKKAIRQINS